MGYSPRDMDFIEAKREAAREIALAYGVPPMLLGIPGDNTYSNYQEANRAFWRQTVLPAARRVLMQLAAWLQPAYAVPFRLEIDADGIDALAAERAALWTRIGAAAFLSDDEKRAAVGYGPMVG
jgi:HK97 family phage portal protein